tara:strand:- start:371 stop:487 length:117 start_codon:yes stop_codon:yes gene_type:complete
MSSKGKMKAEQLASENNVKIYCGVEELEMKEELEFLNG